MSELQDDLFKTCTIWTHLGFDDWTGQDTYAAPVTKACWWKKENKIVKNDQGEEVVSSGYFLSDDFALVATRDMILEGEHTNLDPASLNAYRIITVGAVPDEDFTLYKAYI